MIVDAINRTAIRDIPIPPAVGPTLATARTQGGTHAKARKEARRRNAEAEAFTDSSAADEQEFTPEENPE
jgi:hypothetical protein